MATVEIKHRSTGAVLWSGEAESSRDAVIAAVKVDADLAGADLAGADLAGAYLARADLAGADLAGADLAGAYLARADLADANLAGANLADANLADANLARADLARADLADANLAGAYLAGADLAGADLARADLARADLARANLADANRADAKDMPTLPVDTDPAKAVERAAWRRLTRSESMRRFRERHPDVPIVENLDRKILDSIQSPGCGLEMGAWHTCETTHCRGGWAIHHAGDAGYALEKKVGDPAVAARMIYRASTGRSPHFYAANERALEDIRRCAEEDAA
jgi:hypothetical protein